MAFPAKNTIPLRIFHFHCNAVTFIPEIDLDVFHPPFAIGVIAFKMLVYVNRDLIRVRASDVNRSFIVVDVNRAAWRDVESLLKMRCGISACAGSLAAQTGRGQSNNSHYNHEPPNGALILRGHIRLLTGKTLPAVEYVREWLLVPLDEKTGQR